MVGQADRPILIVDDHSRNIQVLGAALSQEGYLINVARSGKQALEVAVRSPPDLILLDVMMPDMDGYETCRRLKDAPALRDIPVIFLTARSEKEATVRGFAAGAVDYVTKPFHAEELLARVRTQVELRRKTRELEETYAQLRDAHAEQKRLQQELLGAERLKTLLETAGGAAHEISQPLQVITMQMELTLVAMADEDPGRDAILAVLEQARRIDAILKKMQSIERYRTAPYPGGRRIIDFEAASEDVQDA